MTTEKYKIVKVRDGSFVGGDDETVSYFWIKAVRLSDGVTVEYGSKTEDPEGEELTLDLEKYEGKNGKIRYRRVQ